MSNVDLLLEYFPELSRPNLKKTHAKQWDRFLTAFSELCIWIHCSRSAHKNGNGIVLFQNWWDKHFGNHYRWHFDVYEILSNYIISDGKYNYNKCVSREWIVLKSFKHNSINLITDKRFLIDDKWKHIVDDLIHTNSERHIQKGFIKLNKAPIILPNLSVESYLVYNAYKSKLQEGLPISYSVSNTGRLHHPLQNIKKEYRNLIFDGWYSYDFNACAPTILSQEYYRLVPNSTLPSIEVFIQNKKEIREQIALYTGVPEITIKKALTGLFFGQTIPTERQVKWDLATTSSLEKYKFSLVNAFGPEVTEKLLANPIFDSIVTECQQKIMKEISNFLKDTAEYKDGIWHLYNSAGGLKEMERWNTRQVVAHWYFGWEREIIDIASEHLSSIDADYLLIHDGFLSNKQINTNLLLKEILEKTNLKLEITEEKISHTQPLV